MGLFLFDGLMCLCWVSVLVFCGVVGLCVWAFGCLCVCVFVFVCFGFVNLWVL